MNRILLFIFLPLTILTLSACVKDQEEIIPNIRFTGQINFINQDPLYTKNQSFIVKTDSYGKRLGLYGVIVYRLYNEEFYAFDLMCPHEKSAISLVDIVGNNFGYCTCPTCGTVFSVNTEYGGVIEGPSKWPLKMYNTEVNGDNLYIWN